MTWRKYYDAPQRRFHSPWSTFPRISSQAFLRRRSFLLRPPKIAIPTKTLDEPCESSDAWRNLLVDPLKPALR